MEFTVVQGDIAAQQADAVGCGSVVVPILGTGAAGFAFEIGARQVCAEVWDHELSTLTDTRVIAYSEAEYRTLERIAGEGRSEEDG